MYIINCAICGKKVEVRSINYKYCHNLECKKQGKSIAAIKSKKMYRENNKKKICEYNKRYRVKNEESLKRYNERYSKQNRERINVKRRLLRSKNIGIDREKKCLTKLFGSAIQPDIVKETYAYIRIAKRILKMGSNITKLDKNKTKEIIVRIKKGETYAAYE